MILGGLMGIRFGEPLIRIDDLFFDLDAASRAKRMTHFNLVNTHFLLGTFWACMGKPLAAGLGLFMLPAAANILAARLLRRS